MIFPLFIPDRSIRAHAFHCSLFIVTSWWDVVWNAGWRSLLNLMSPEEQEQFKEEHMKEVTDLVGKDGVWFNTEVMIAVGEKL